MAKRIASLLNSSKACNIFEKESDGITDLITDYFAETTICSTERWSDDSESDSDVERDGFARPNAEKMASFEEELADEIELEEPIVRVEGGMVHSDNNNMDCNGSSNRLILQAQQFSCNCKQIKVVPRDGDPRKGCITQFSADEIVAVNLSMQELDRESKDMLILGLISSCIRNSNMTECTKQKEQVVRQKSRSSYSYMGRSICTKAFIKLLSISQNKLKALSTHFQENGLVPRKMKSGGRKNNTASLSMQDTERTVNFIKQYAEEHAVSLPGRVPGFKRDDIQLLPSSSQKIRVYRKYAEAADKAGYRKIGSSTFRKLWIQLCPFIVVARPMTDLCWKCQKNNTHIFQSANMTLEEKSELIIEQQQHLTEVAAERQFYRDIVSRSKVTVAQHKLQRLQETLPNSKDMEMHYSFDFAQQVHIPSNAAQPGPMYFLTARKCAIFGVCCEGLPQQINYLIDESVNTSKGSNGVISYLHHFFAKYGLGEKSMHLHCDNCAGQNKNRYVLWYFCWRVLHGLHTDITINFMPSGHTKFAPDWCFGLLKRYFRRCEVSCLDDLCEVVKESTATTKVNLPQLVGHEDATVEVPTYNWQTFFAPAFKPLVGIKKIAHFRFSTAYPGRVFYKCALADHVENHFDMTNTELFQTLADMPEMFTAPGLPLERQTYLYNHIRQFVREDKRDVVCPKPANL